MNATKSRGPLTGYRVIEMCSTIAGPVCARLLADFGAEVIKIEPPEGDVARNMGPQEDGESLYCASMFRNKKVICIDIKTTAGQELTRNLIKTSDFLVENFRPGTLERLNLGYDTLHKLNERLIMVRISGYGQTGPYSDLPGYGVTCEATAGVRYLTGDPDRPPVRVGLAVTDYLTAVYAAFGSLLALEQRHQSGKGQVVDAALYEAAFSMMETYVAAYPRLGFIPERQGSRLMNTAPNSLYLCSDGSYILINATSDSIFERLASTLGHPEWSSDPRYKTQVARGNHVAELDELVQKWTSQLEASEIMDMLRSARVPVAKVNTIADIFTDPHFLARDMLLPVSHPTLGEVILPGIVPRLSESPGEIREPGHRFGADTNEVLTRILGMSTRAVKELYNSNVVR